MRPEIAALLVPAIYSQLDPAPNVMEYSDVLGMEANVFCVSHSQKESQVVSIRFLDLVRVIWKFVFDFYSHQSP